MREDRTSRASAKESADPAIAQPENTAQSQAKNAEGAEKPPEAETSASPGAAAQSPPTQSPPTQSPPTQSVEEKQDTPKAAPLQLTDSKLTDSKLTDSKLTDSKSSVATEKPFFSPEPPAKTSQYVVTVDNRTGFAIQIETLDGKSGERKPLMSLALSVPVSPSEADAAHNATASAGGDVVPSAPDPALMEAYLRGVRDYLTAVSSWR